MGGNNRNTYVDSYFDEMEIAALNGDMETLRNATKSNINYKRLMTYGACEGRVEVVKWCKKQGVDDYDSAMQESSLGGHIEIVKLCREWGSRNFSYSMGRAAEGKISM